MVENTNIPLSKMETVAVSKPLPDAGSGNTLNTARIDHRSSSQSPSAHSHSYRRIYSSIAKDMLHHLSRARVTQSKGVHRSRRSEDRASRNLLGEIARTPAGRPHCSRRSRWTPPKATTRAPDRLDDRLPKPTPNVHVPEPSTAHVEPNSRLCQSRPAHQSTKSGVPCSSEALSRWTLSTRAPRAMYRRSSAESACRSCERIS